LVNGKGGKSRGGGRAVSGYKCGMGASSPKKRLPSAMKAKKGVLWGETDASGESKFHKGDP